MVYSCVLTDDFCAASGFERRHPHLAAPPLRPHHGHPHHGHPLKWCGRWPHGCARSSPSPFCHATPSRSVFANHHHQGVRACPVGSAASHKAGGRRKGSCFCRRTASRVRSRSSEKTRWSRCWVSSPAAAPLDAFGSLAIRGAAGAPWAHHGCTVGAPWVHCCPGVPRARVPDWAARDVLQGRRSALGSARRHGGGRHPSCITRLFLWACRAPQPALGGAWPPCAQFSSIL